MSKIAKITLCALLIVALAIPALAGGAPGKRSTASKVKGAIYKGGATALETTEGVVTGCLRRTFSLFNPCLDFVKGCATVALMPIEKPLDFVEKAAFKPRHVRKAAAKKIPVPQKPEIPQK
jgi:hypothetical protein